MKEKDKNDIDKLIEDEFNLLLEKYPLGITADKEELFKVFKTGIALGYGLSKIMIEEHLKDILKKPSFH